MLKIYGKAIVLLSFFMFTSVLAYSLNDLIVDTPIIECTASQESLLSCERTLPNGQKQTGSGWCKCVNRRWSGGCTLPEITYTEVGLSGSRTCTMPLEIRGCSEYSEVPVTDGPVCGEWSGGVEEEEGDVIEIANRCNLGDLQFRPDPDDECATQTRKCCNPKASLSESPWGEWGEDCNLNDCSGSWKPRVCLVENGTCTIKECKCVSGNWECTKDITCNTGFTLSGEECKSNSTVLPPITCTKCTSNADCTPCGLVCVNLSTNPGMFIGVCQRGFNGNI